MYISLTLLTHPLPSPYAFYPRLWPVPLENAHPSFVVIHSRFSPLAEELQYLLRVWLLAGCLSSKEWSHMHTHRAILIGLREFLITTKGVCGPVMWPMLLILAYRSQRQVYVWEDKAILLCIGRHRETLSQNKANIHKRQIWSWKIQQVRSEDH